MTTGQKGTPYSALFFPSLNIFTEKPQPTDPTFNVCPPQINWASRPIARPDTPSESKATPGCAQHQETACGRRLVGVFVDADRLPELEDVLRRIDLPFFLAPCPDHVGEQSNELEQLTASLSFLSTSEDLEIKASDLFPPRTIYQDDPRAPPLVSPGKKRYYSITVGKCTGIYWDTW